MRLGGTAPAVVISRIQNTAYANRSVVRPNSLIQRNFGRSCEHGRRSGTLIELHGRNLRCQPVCNQGPDPVFGSTPLKALFMVLSGKTSAKPLNIGPPRCSPAPEQPTLSSTTLCRNINKNTRFHEFSRRAENTGPVRAPQALWAARIECSVADVSIFSSKDEPERGW